MCVCVWGGGGGSHEVCTLVRLLTWSYLCECVQLFGPEICINTFH